MSIAPESQGVGVKFKTPKLTGCDQLDSSRWLKICVQHQRAKLIGAEGGSREPGGGARLKAPDCSVGRAKKVEPDAKALRTQG